MDKPIKPICKEYDFLQLERYWQHCWKQEKTFKAQENPDKPKYYVLDMFPYPSAAGLHIGHPEGYTASDILTRYQWGCGREVLHPMGWDAFGLPAEQYAIKTGVHPALTTQANIDQIRRQIQSLGFAIDWDREVNTTDPQYYRWTQWIFLQLFKAGLAYVDERPVWWCPDLGSVLANEEVINGRSERGNHPVERRSLRQWVLRITAYADKLLEGLADLDWPDSTKRQQIAWIGRSEGARLKFSLEKGTGEIEVFTTRVDTLWGVTYLVLAPEHPLVPHLVTAEQKTQVASYQRQAEAKSDLERTDLAKEKSGVFTGSYALHPLTGERIPVWVADYVLATYASGAVMAVPAHDSRDFEFAQHYQLEIRTVVEPLEDTASGVPFCGFGRIVRSGPLSGLTSQEAIAKALELLQKAEKGAPAVQYKLRDWLFSRQRYWGEPVPIIWVKEADYRKVEAYAGSPLRELMPIEPVSFTDSEGQPWYALPLTQAHLPLLLPEIEDYKPLGTGESPLASAQDWVQVALNLQTGEVLSRKELPANRLGSWIFGRRETHTMPQWAGSCWYHLRYMDPHNTETLVDPKKEAYWNTPDFYIGGAEHAVLHLLYARFWHRFLYDQGLVSQPEPYRRLFHQGIILGEDGEKMSKSRGNVVNPDSIIQEYGADSLRLFEMFLGPLEMMKPWSTQGIEGVWRFLKKLWRTLIDAQTGSVLAQRQLQPGAESPELKRLLHETVRKVTHDIENLRLNTAIAQMMTFLNHWACSTQSELQTAHTFLRLLEPFAPHITQELYSRIGGGGMLVHQPWPGYDLRLLESTTQAVVVQVNGKLRGELQVAVDASAESVLAQAKALPKVAELLQGKQLLREVYVPGKVVNFVLGALPS